jgi:hypothetical protein
VNIAFAREETMTVALNIAAPRRSTFAAPGFQRVDARVTRPARTTAVDSFVGATPSGPALDTARRLNPMNPNGRYWPRDGQTFCNFYTQDTLRARGHRVLRLQSVIEVRR